MWKILLFLTCLVLFFGKRHLSLNDWQQLSFISLSVEFDTAFEGECLFKACIVKPTLIFKNDRLCVKDIEHFESDPCQYVHISRQLLFIFKLRSLLFF